MHYSGLDVRETSKFSSKPELYDICEFKNQFGNADNKMKVFHEYLIYDTMSMIGSVGGTLGIFIGFSMTGVISSFIALFKERNNWKEQFVLK